MDLEVPFGRRTEIVCTPAVAGMLRHPTIRTIAIAHGCFDFIMTVGEVSDLGVKFSKRRDGKDLFPGGTTTLNRRQVISSKTYCRLP